MTFSDEPFCRSVFVDELVHPQATEQHQRCHQAKYLQQRKQTMTTLAMRTANKINGTKTARHTHFCVATGYASVYQPFYWSGTNWSI